MNDHEIGMNAPVVKGLDNQCQHWKSVCSDLMIEVQELKLENALLKAKIGTLTDAQLEGAKVRYADANPIVKVSAEQAESQKTYAGQDI